MSSESDADANANTASGSQRDSNQLTSDESESSNDGAIDFSSTVFSLEGVIEELRSPIALPGSDLLAFKSVNYAMIVPDGSALFVVMPHEYQGLHSFPLLSARLYFRDAIGKSLCF
jgi:hypothetical protein